MNALNIGNGYTTYLLVGFVANVLFMTIFNNISVREKLLNVMVVISNGTLVYLCFHGMLIQMYKIVYKKLMHIHLPPPYMDTVSGLIITFCILIILYYPAKRILNSKYRGVRFLAGKN